MVSVTPNLLGNSMVKSQSCMHGARNKSRTTNKKKKVDNLPAGPRNMVSRTDTCTAAQVYGTGETDEIYLTHLL
jgi:hypothetical protein